MFHFSSANKNLPMHSIFRWFLVGFVSFSLILFAALLPLVFYSRSVFTELEIKKSTQQMDFGVNQLDNTITTIVNASQAFYDDNRFYALHYTEKNYTDISAVTRGQMCDYLSSLIRPCPLIRDCALQLSENDAVTPVVTTFGLQVGYYPFYFRVDEMTYDEWNALLQENKTGFLGVHRVTTTYNGSYDALIYSIYRANNRYFYACIDISQLKKNLIASEDRDSYLLTLHNSNGDCIYTELTEPTSGYYSVSRKTASGGLTITMHIPNSALTARMKPLYSFLSIYLVLCVLVLGVSIPIGTHLSTRPLTRIIHTLEKNQLTAAPAASGEASSTQKASFGYGFHYIYDQIQTYETNLHQRQAIIDTQTNVLQVIFMEKALHGLLASESDLEAFYSYFPDFPNSYRLILFGLAEKNTEAGNLYSHALAIIQYYLQQLLPHVYMQQQTTQTLLLVAPETDVREYSDIINHLIENINREEPGYHAWGLVSKQFTQPTELSSAYIQLQDLRNTISTESLSQLCTVSDIKQFRKSGFQISDTLTIYSAITSGNSELALTQLQGYAEHLYNNNRAVFEMYRSILLCIKQDYANLLIDTTIPSYHPQRDLFASLETCIITFCELFHSESDEHSESFAEQVKAYIDLHFTDAQLCSATLEEQFHCSFSKIRKSFSKDIGIPISSYIEQKRMTLANELLLEGEFTVSEIALKCGFTNYNSFFKVYRRTFGYAPSMLNGKKGKS